MLSSSNAKNEMNNLSEIGAKNDKIQKVENIAKNTKIGKSEIENFYAKDTIHITFLKEALQAYADKGIKSDWILREAGINPNLLHQQNSRVSALSYGKFWRLSAEMFDDEFFGMDSHRMKQGSIHYLIMSALSADSLGAAIEKMLSFMHLLLDDFNGFLKLDNKQAYIILEANSNKNLRAFSFATYFLLIHGIACWLVGRRIPIKLANFVNLKPEFCPEWEIFFSPSLKFAEHSISSISFDKDFLKLPIVRNSFEANKFVQVAPINLLVKYRDYSGWNYKVRHFLQDIEPAKYPDLNSLAKNLNLSSATLHRRLKEEGASYQMILDELRFDLASKILTNPDSSIENLAYELGYSERMAFERAFKKWSGMSPAEYRKMLLYKNL